MHIPAGERRLGALAAQHLVLRGRQLVTPLSVGLVDLRAHFSLRIRFHYVGPERDGNGSTETGQADAGAEQPAQRHPTAVQTTLKSALAEVEHRRRLARGKPFHVAQHHGSTEVDRQLAQRGGERVAYLVALDFLVGPRGVGRQIVERAILGGHDRSRGRPFREPPLRFVVGDPVEPGEEACAALETGQAAPRAEERLLGHVPRLVVVEAEAAKYHVDGVGMAHYELLEGLHVALAGALYEGGVVVGGRPLSRARHRPAPYAAARPRAPRPRRSPPGDQEASRASRSSAGGSSAARGSRSSRSCGARSARARDRSTRHRRTRTYEPATSGGRTRSGAVPADCPCSGRPYASALNRLPQDRVSLREKANTRREPE